VIIFILEGVGSGICDGKQQLYTEYTWVKSRSVRCRSARNIL